jgi:hypothetical protein
LSAIRGAVFGLQSSGLQRKLCEIHLLAASVFHTTYKQTAESGSGFVVELLSAAV